MSAALGADYAPAADGLAELLERSNLTGRQLLIHIGQRLHPNMVLYDVAYVIDWPDLEPERFAGAWETLLEASDALRTVIVEDSGVPQQRVLPARPVDIECADVSAATDVGSALEEWIAERLRRPMVRAERAFDTALIRTGKRRFAWFLNLEPMIADAEGAGILIDEVFKLYGAGPGARTTVPAFGDHVADERLRRQSNTYREAVQYWRWQVAEGCGAPELYGVRPTTLRQIRVVLRLDAVLSARLVSVARSLQAATRPLHDAAANLFASVLAIYLRRIGSGPRVGVGTIHHNRHTARDRDTIGLFMEILPLILDVNSDANLAEVMDEVQQQMEQALLHCSYSVPNAGRAPAYVALLNYMQPLRTRPPTLGVRGIHSGYGSHAVSLSVAVPAENDPGSGYELWFDINADVAAASSAQVAANHFLTLLKSALDDPRRPLATLQLVPDAEQQRLRQLGTGPELDCGSPGGCLAAFEAQAARTPDAVAIVVEGRTMAYVQLNDQANALAQRLSALGARRGRFVGIHLERSSDMVVAVLAILKTGAAYVPLDPAYPTARLRAMLDDSTPAILLTRTVDLAALPPHAAHVVLMDKVVVAPSEPSPSLNSGITDSDIAYLMYTSGTSGTPKGVLMTHGGVRNYLAWRSSYFPLTAADRCLHKASLSFDDSVWEILEPLSTGACLVLARPRFEYDTAYLVRLMRDEQITAACFVPSLLRALVEEPGAAACHALRRLTTGAETLTMALQRRVHERFAAATLYNGYGTTETAIASTFWRCIDEPHAPTVPIGFPIANTEVHLLDAARLPVPQGVPGEICIGGAGLAQGYFDRPALTVERFIEHPLAGSSGAKRLYRTGDLGRWRADGALEFLGRIDDQVKVNGVRIELGDIEAALLDHAAVKAAAVVCRDSTAGGSMLVTYLVPSGPGLPGRTEFRAFLRDRLPAPMIPGRFESLPSLPMTPSGKLDRGALRKLPLAMSEEHLPVAPRNEREGQLHMLWEGLLEARPIGVQDDFFALGGHSLLALRLVVAINDVLGCHLSPEVLFETPTIEGLARRIANEDDTRSGGPAGGDVLVPLALGGAGTPLYLIHQIDGEVARYRELARHLRGRLPVYGIRAANAAGGSPLDRIESMARHYVEVLRAQQPHGPYALGGHSSGGFIAIEMARLLHSQGEQIALLAMFDVDAQMRKRRSILDAFHFHRERFRSLPPAYRRVYVWRNLSLLGRAITSRVRPSRTKKGKVAAAHGPVRAAMEHAVHNYRPTPYAGEIVLFRACDRSISGTFGRSLGWAPLSGAPVRVIDVPGNHLTMLQAGAAEELAAHVLRCL